MKPQRCVYGIVASALVVFLASPALGVQGGGEIQQIRPDGVDLSLLSLTITETNNCGLVFEGFVRTDDTGGTDTFSIFVTDGGVAVGGQDFALPADGAIHPLAFQLDFQYIFANDNWGLLIEDPGGLGTVVIDDFFPISTCSIQNIPTLSTTGAAGFGLLLAGAAALVLYRRRRG